MNENVKKIGIKYGIITGVISILVTFIMYIIDCKLFVNIWVGLSLLLLYLIIGSIQLNELRKNNNNLLSFKDGFTAYFVGALIGIIISTIFSIILFNYIDTDARDFIHEELINSQVEMMKKYNVPNSEIIKMVDELKNNPQFTVKGLSMGVMKSLIGSVLFGLILGAIFKRKPKEQF